MNMPLNHRKLHRRAGHRALGLGLAVIGAPAAAADAPYSLGEVVVTAHKPVVEQAGTVREVDRAQIEASAARSLDEAIDLLPGVNVRVGGQGVPRVDVRGLRTRHVKLLLNGIPFNSAADGQFDPTIIPAEWISKIKLTSGASSQLYGDGALGGVINIVTRRGDGPMAAEFSAEAGELDARRYNGSFAWGNDDADVFVTLGHRERDSFALAGDFTPASFEDGDKRLNGGLLRDSAYASASWRPREAWEFGLSLQYVDGERGMPTGIFDNTLDSFAQRPRYDRIEDERSYYVQANALYEPNERWRNNAWVYTSAGVSELSRYEDERFLPVSDPSVRNSFDDEARTRTTGFHNQTEFTHRWDGTLSFMIDGRQERLVGECVIQDVPLVIPAPPTPPPPPPAAPPTTLVLDYTYTTTNDAGITTAGGANAPIARLTASNRAGGGVDFSITNLAGNNYGAGSFLQSVFISPIAGFDPTGLSFTQAAGSQADIGNVRFFSTLENADGYLYPIQVNFRRPGQGDAFLQGDTASWLFSKGTVTDFFGAPVGEAGAVGPNMFSTIRLRGTDANGFWGASPVDNTGGGALNRVFVGAPTTVDPNAPPPAPLVPVPDLSGQLLQDRVCGGGAGGGDGSGGGEGDGTGGNRVERLAGFAFGKRLIEQDRAVEVLNSATELSFHPWPALGVVAGVGYHWLRGDDEEVTGDYGYNVGATLRVREGLRLKATHARKVRPPSIAQLHDPVSGNAGLDFEIAELYEAGARQALGLDSSVDVTFFTQDVSGLIQRNLVSGLFENVASTDIKGVEFTATTVAIPRLRLDLSYTHLTSRDESPGTQRKQQQYTPGNTVSLSGVYRLREDLRLFTSLLRVSEQFHYSRTTPLARRELDAYTLLDANLHYDLPGKRVALYVGADNLFDANYEESYGLPQQGRFIYGGIKLSLR
jgi:outer membrane cobalamin receptor